jgi:uncharacterized protein involved in exopolysaccharide biosynthesis
MNEDPAELTNQSRPLRDDRMVFLLPADDRNRPSMGLRELWETLWGKKLLIIAITAVFSLSAVAYALLADQWFKAEVVLVPAKSTKGLPGQLGGLAGLASLAGVNIGEKGDTVEALAVLRSNDFVRSFIDERKLLPVLFAEQWDGANRRWKSSNPEDRPDDRDAVKFFQRSICQITNDQLTGLVTVAIEWKDRETAAEWANALVARLNEQMRQRVLVESERNVKFLRDELAAADIPTLQQSISRLLESELQTLMLARGNPEFAFRVVDRANPPKWRSRPKRTLLVCAATLGGGIFAVVVVLLMRTLQRSKP